MTGVQTCALPISAPGSSWPPSAIRCRARPANRGRPSPKPSKLLLLLLIYAVQFIGRSLGMITCPDANEWTGCGTCGVCRAFGSTQRRGMWEFSNSPWLQADTMSRVEESKIKTYARIAIDRFTGGTRNGALFEQRYQPNLTMELKVVGPRLPDEYAWVERALLHAMRDLNDGLITLGGRGAIGFGMVTVQAVEFAGITVDFSRLDPVIERDAK